jgi:TIR domain-containing protein
MTDIASLKKLWGSTTNSSVWDQITDAITSSGDLEAMKWLWGKTTNSERWDQITESIANSGNVAGIEWLLNKTSNQRRKEILTKALLSGYTNKNISFPTKTHASQPKETIELKQAYKYDVFLSHASEDKDVFVRPLADKLKIKGYTVWYDEFSLLLGDSLRRSIDHGLVNSRFGVVILSVNFFKKEWPQKELDGLVAREDVNGKIILPVWHGVTKDQVKSFSPILSDRVAVSSNKGLDYVSDEIIRVLER